MALTLNELKAVCKKAGPSADFFASSVIEALGFRVEVLPNDHGLFVGSIEEYRGGYSRAYYIYEVDFDTGRVVVAGPHRSYSSLKLAQEGLKHHTKEKAKLNA